MDKKDLIPGKTYLRKHKVTVHGRYGNKEAEAEGYIESFIYGRPVNNGGKLAMCGSKKKNKRIKRGK